MFKTAVRLYIKKHFFLLVAIVFFAVYYHTIFKLPERATVFPRLLIYLIIPITAWNLIRSIYDVVKEASEIVKNNPEAATADRDPSLLKKGLVLALTLVYVTLIPIVGFHVTTTIYLGVVLFVLGIKKPLSIFIYVVIINLFLFLTFTLWVGLQFPRGILI